MKNEILNSNKPDQSRQNTPESNSVQDQVTQRIEQASQSQNNIEHRVVQPSQNATAQPIPRFEQVRATENKPRFEEVEVRNNITQTLSTRNDSYFDGKMLDLLGLKILEIFITALTLGLAAPWVACVVYNYKFSHTIYNGKRLKFEGKAEDLFLNMFRWFFFTLITCGIYALVIPAKRTSWVVSNLHFEDEEFVKGDSFFYGDTLGFIGVNLLCYILTGISFGLLYPFTVCYKLRWINSHSVINRKKLIFKGKAMSLFGNYLLWGFLSLITFGIYGLWFEVNYLKWRAKNTYIKKAGEKEKTSGSGKAIAIISIVIAAIVVIGLLVLVVPSLISNISGGSSINPFKAGNKEVTSEHIRYDVQSMDDSSQHEDMTDDYYTKYIQQDTATAR